MYQLWVPLLPGFTWSLTFGGFLIGLLWLVGYSLYLAALVAFHGTYWHDNFGTPMSRGCVNMRIDEARWLFRWVRPLHEPNRIYTPGYGTLVNIHP